MQSRNKREGRYAGYYYRHVRTRGRLGVSNIGVSSPAARYSWREKAKRFNAVLKRRIARLEEQLYNR